MSFPGVPNVTPSITLTKEDAYNLLLASIAFEELGLSHILNAEGEKIQYAVGSLPGLSSPATIDDLLKVNDSVSQTLKNTVFKEMVLQEKLDSILNATAQIPGPTGATGATGFGLECDPDNNLLAGGSVAGVGALQNTVYGCEAGAAAPLQNENTVLIGFQAGYSGAGSGSVSVGSQAGQNDQGSNAVAVGPSAGQNNQGIRTVAVGPEAGQSNQRVDAVAVGFRAGEIDQGSRSVAVGERAGRTGQGDFSVAIGGVAGAINQGINSTAIGIAAGTDTQGDSCVAVGRDTGRQNQGTNAVAVGRDAGGTDQGISAVAIGRGAGLTGQGTQSVAIGLNAGSTSQGADSVAVGRLAGQTDQAPNSIALNASGAALNPTTDGFFVNPIRETDTALPTLMYDSTSSEIFRSTSKTFVINHPIDTDKYLVHACLEGPEAGVYYRGKSSIPEGSDYVTIELPEYVDQFATDLTIHLTAIYNGRNITRPLSYSEVENGKFNVHGDSGISFSWILHGKRNDIEVEPTKTNVKVEGSGPYRWIESQ